MSLIKEEEGRDICRGEEGIFGFITWQSGAVRVGGAVRFAGDVIESEVFKRRIRKAQIKQRLKCYFFYFILFYGFM